MTAKLKFLGAAQNVTGSCYLLESGDCRILVDCGLYQERAFRNRNFEPFPVPPDTIDAVLITHAHLDHCGLLPKLVKEGFKGKIHCTRAAAEIAEIVLLDSARIQEEDAEYKKRRHKREGREGPRPIVPAYTVEDAENTIPHFSTVNYREPLKLKDQMEATFYNAGHIFGSAMIKVSFSENGERRTVLFSGDVGRWDKPIIDDPSTFFSADYVLVESTYGDRNHDETEDIPTKLADVINRTYQSGGNIVVPSFAIERSQELLYYLNKLLIDDRIPTIMVFLDSPMAIRVTEVFKSHPDLFDEEMAALVRLGQSPFDFPGLIMSVSTDQSKAINHIKGTSMIIAGSGMCTGGRIKHHLAANISRSESTLLFVGYQAADTLGRIIVNGAKQVRILGQEHTVRATVEQIGGFSAHADRNELLRWLTGLIRKPRNVFVTHGEAETAMKFRDFLQDQTGWKVDVPEYLDEIILNY